MNINKNKKLHRISRHKRVRANIMGTKERPRVSVFKSNRHVFVQFIDDNSRQTVVSGKVVSSGKSKIKGGYGSVPSKGSKTEKAMKIGEMLAEKAKEAGIKEVIFDRGGFKYHGRIKAVADGLRKGGIKL
ncbi:MAG: 50S ribosomal protein L18 [Candidatus Yanofskybacteria bacterium]|nr:50S ribosomal protein L18 [Candidatus Yanofskybacteria bacterium]